MTYQAGRHFLQVPGPSNIPDRILRAIAQPVLDHRGPAWAKLQSEIFERIRPVFKTKQPVMIFPASGTGGWESALVNTLSPGDQVLTFDTGQFAVLWGNMAHKLGLDVQMLATDWRRAPSPEAVEAVLTADKAHKIKAILLVHNETSNGVMSRVAEIRSMLAKLRPERADVYATASIAAANNQASENSIVELLQPRYRRTTIAIWATAFLRTRVPISTIRPDSSATGTNSPGETMPRWGWFQRTSASAPTPLPSVQTTCGW